MILTDEIESPPESELPLRVETRSDSSRTGSTFAKSSPARRLSDRRVTRPGALAGRLGTSVSLVLASLLVGACGDDQTHLTPLEAAASADDATRTRALIAAGEDPDAHGREWAPLILAARTGRVQALRALVAADADVDRPDDRQGWSALLHAVHRNQLDAAGALLELGADPDRGSRSGFTPLMMASSYGNTRMVELLLRGGANPHLTLRNGESALSMAATGSVDIDRFTLGRCQEATVRALLEHDPALRVSDSWLVRWEMRFVRTFGCEEVARLLDPLEAGRAIDRER
jgi:hypothetical protein